MRTAAPRWALLAAVSAVSAQQQCTQVSSVKPWLYRCPGGGKIMQFDLSSLNQSSPTQSYLTATDVQGHNYYFGRYGVLTGVTCTPATGTGVPVAIQSWGSDSPPVLPAQCGWLGVRSTQNCTLSPAPLMSQLPPSMLCQYTGGTDNRQVTIHYKCQPGLPTTLAAEQVWVRAAAACTAYQLPRPGAALLPPIPPAVASLRPLGGHCVLPMRHTRMSATRPHAHTPTRPRARARPF
jgi:hypothetical protein